MLNNPKYKSISAKRTWNQQLTRARTWTSSFRILRYSATVFRFFALASSRWRRPYSTRSISRPRPTSVLMSSISQKGETYPVRSSKHCKVPLGLPDPWTPYTAHYADEFHYFGFQRTTYCVSIHLLQKRTSAESWYKRPWMEAQNCNRMSCRINIIEKNIYLTVPSI